MTASPLSSPRIAQASVRESVRGGAARHNALEIFGPQAQKDISTHELLGTHSLTEDVLRDTYFSHAPDGVLERDKLAQVLREAMVARVELAGVETNGSDEEDLIELIDEHGEQEFAAIVSNGKLGLEGPVLG